MSISRADAALLLRRAGFGATRDRIDLLSSAASWEAAVDAVLDTSGDTPLEWPAHLDGATTMARRVGMTEAWLEHMRTGPAPIVDKLTLFWHGHFATSTDKVSTYQGWDMLQTTRRHAMGSFHDLAQAVAVEPAMLLYLDNHQNRAPGQVNENFARELMELFILGRDTHTQEDVMAMARAWSGHNLDGARERYRFHAERHDHGPKTLFGVTRDWDGPEALTEMLRGRTAPVAARFVAAKLWRFLAGPEPSAQLVDDLAAAFLAADLDIAALVRAVFLRPEMRATATRDGLVRTPVEWVVATLQAVDVRVGDTQAVRWLEQMGHLPFVPPSVAGWGGNEAWLTTAGAWARCQFLIRLRGVATFDNHPYRRFEGLEDLPPAEVASTILDTFGLVDASPATRAVLEEWATTMDDSTHVTGVRGNAILLGALAPEFGLA